ncbi:hypothetical protein BUALT_Bualt12G0078200 [Buddleja alternifolia]|uniref:Uncharacterized protein n=1 Tax=Buddleja alternifolia TaxID=168488 RepID=A0AAV6X052_9LAMI|nr:hypothetical protein BUALT_Bualt12G0078200 [Buddleja alternifolia]
MKRQVISGFCLIMCVQAITFIACQRSTYRAKFPELATDTNKREMPTDLNLNVGKPSIEGDKRHTDKRGVVQVVHARRGSNGGANIAKKPARNKSSSFPLNLGYINLSLCVVFNYLFLIL